MKPEELTCPDNDCGSIPFLSQCAASMREIDFSSTNIVHNNLTDILSLHNLRVVNMNHNDFSRSLIPNDWTNLEALQELRLRSGNISGTITNLHLPDNVSFVDISENRLTGVLPRSLPASLQLLDVHISIICHPFATPDDKES